MCCYIMYKSSKSDNKVIFPPKKRSKLKEKLSLNNIIKNRYIVLPKKIYQKILKADYPIDNGYKDIKYSFFISNDNKDNHTCDIQCFDLLIASNDTNPWYPVLLPYTTVFTYDYANKKVENVEGIINIEYV